MNPRNWLKELDPLSRKQRSQARFPQKGALCLRACAPGAGGLSHSSESGKQGNSASHTLLPCKLKVTHPTHRVEKPRPGGKKRSPRNEVAWKGVRSGPSRPRGPD